MSTADAFLRSWPYDPWLLAGMVLSAAVYVRGWLLLHRRDPLRWHGGRLAAFFGGLAATFTALASPIEPFSSLLFQVHMVQHMLLMMVAPPLFWRAAPLFPLVCGLPEGVRAVWIAPLLRWQPLRAACAWLVHPLVAWTIFVGVTWLWHVPAAYDLALTQYGWHVTEHVCFFAAGMLFWFPVVRPYPSRPRWPVWFLCPYLILCSVQSSMLAAWLTFSEHVIYSHYAQLPRIGGISALTDQQVAGAIMWVPGSAAFLLPLVGIGVALLAGEQRRGDRPKKKLLPGPPSSIVLPVLNAPPLRSQSLRRPAFDLLEVPVLGSFLRWRHSRVTLQALMGVMAVIVIYDGLRGPQVTPMNLAGVAPWIHWRGVLVFGLLVGGNFFCMACPFALPRAAARRWMPGGREWPRWLRSKWLAAGLVAIFLWSYEAFALWDSPWVTAWIAIGYFVAALVVDAWFRGAAFCKYVCPIGQFNFVQSLVSPLTVQVREPAVCASCRTKECIRGTATIPGCEMGLYQPRKQGNLDCTFCLDCVHACPHENVGVLSTAPARDLWSDRFRSGIGRLSERRDIAALVVVLVFGSLANAAGMVAPVVAWQDRVQQWLGNPSRVWLTSFFYLAALVAIPAATVAAAAIASRAWGRIDRSWPAVATRYAYALVPLGFGMWLAHYSFHFLTSFDTIVPTTQRFVADVGWANLGEPMWQLACCRPVSAGLTHLQVLMLDFGLVLSLHTGYRIAEEDSTRGRPALRAFAPWAVLIVALFVVGVWIVYQPMEMRGTMGAGG